MVGKQDVGCCIEGCLVFRVNCAAMEIAGVLVVIGEDEQATGAAVEPVEGGKIILETLRILGLAFRGPRSCCTARQTDVSRLIEINE